MVREAASCLFESALEGGAPCENILVCLESENKSGRKVDE